MTKAKEIGLTQTELRMLFDYSKATGVFKWKVKPARNIRVGDIAGSLDKLHGYLVIGYNKRRYKAHRLAWLYVHGEIPQNLHIDHIDLSKTNNSIDNLRLATDSENKMNTGIRSTNTSGFRGVTWDNNAGKWRARIMLYGKNVHLGLFTDKQEAVAVCKTSQLEHYKEFYILENY